MRDANPTAQQKTPRSSGWSCEGPLKNPRRYLLSRLLHYHRLGKLNYCVRDGNRCFLSDMVTGKAPRRSRLETAAANLSLGKWLHSLRYGLLACRELVTG